MPNSPVEALREARVAKPELCEEDFYGWAIQQAGAMRPEAVGHRLGESGGGN